MKKKVLPIFMALLLVVSSAACDSTPSSESSSPVSTQSSQSSLGEPLSSVYSGTETSYPEEEAMISEIMKSELGESNPVEILSVSEEREIEEGSFFYTVNFQAGQRSLIGSITISNGKKYLSSISSGDDPLHYYYYPGAAEVNAIGVITIHLYDYNTEEEINLDATTSMQQETQKSEVSEILADLQSITVDLSETNDTFLSLNVAIDSPYSADLDLSAEHFYYDCLKFISKYFSLDSLPYKNLAFNIILDGKNVGTMALFSTPELGLVGTSTPVIVDQEIYSVFSAKYDEYMMDVDASNFIK